MCKAASLKSSLAAMAAARNGVYWLDEEVEMMLEALVDLEAGVEYISSPGETQHVEEEGERGQLEGASLPAPEGPPTPVVISSAVESENGSRASTSKQALLNDLPGVVQRVEALEKSFKSLKAS
ncbi:UNVERIFIED_CONTAM: hypothetical protein K2H54_058762, partial [Gekko kuhli]